MNHTHEPDDGVYLDHAASTPMHPEAVAAMTAQLARPGNASALHAAGRAARRVVEESRETVARAIGCRPGEVVFTSGGTESDNLAVKGLFWARRDADPRRVRILSTSVEHHAVLDALHWLSDHEGADVELLPVDEQGRLDVAALRASLERDPDSVALVSVMWANNEVGTRAAGRRGRRAGAPPRRAGPHRRGAGRRAGAGRLRRERRGRARR